MPSQNRRMALTLPPELDKAIFDLAEEAGKPASRITVELLQEMLPHIEAATKLHRAAKTGNKAAAKRAMVNLVGDAMAAILLEQQDLFAQPKKARSK